jgi:hypothetical protein
MRLPDHSAEYYRLRETLERALALRATSDRQRGLHLQTAERYAALSRALLREPTLAMPRK